jgi:hypothetical protein
LMQARAAYRPRFVCKEVVILRALQIVLGASIKKKASENNIWRARALKPTRLREAASALSQKCRSVDKNLLGVKMGL